MIRVLCVYLRNTAMEELDQLVSPETGEVVEGGGQVQVWGTLILLRELLHQGLRGVVH